MVAWHDTGFRRDGTADSRKNWQRSCVFPQVIDRRQLDRPNTAVTWTLTLWIVALGAVALGLIIGVTGAIRTRQRRRVGQQTLFLWRDMDESSRIGALRRRIAEWPENPVGWYLLGCCQLRSGHVKDAAQCFGMAYHQDVELESAALLTFACLKSRDGAGSDILDQMAITWGEMRKPDLSGSPADRLLMSALDADDGPETLSTLGRLAWSVSGVPQRDELQARPAGKADVHRPLYR